MTDMWKQTFSRILKISMLALSVLHLNLSVLAQSNTFSKLVYDSLGSSLQGTAIAPTLDKGYLIGGSILFKLDSAGNMKWNKTYTNCTLNCMCTTNDSCFLLAGLGSTGFQNVTALIKINQLGDTLWTRSIDVNGNLLRPLYVQQTIDSGYMMTGYTFGSSTTTSISYFTAKTDRLGNLVWANTISGGNNNNVGYSMKETPDNGYIVAGYVENDPPDVGNAVLTKFDHSGNIVWAKKYTLSSTTMCSFNDIVITQTGFLGYLAFNKQITILKTDFQGNILWAKYYKQTTNNNIVENSKARLHPTSDGGFVFASQEGLYKMDSTGNILWSKAIEPTGNQPDIDLVLNKDKGVTIKQTGYRGAAGNAVGVIRTDSLGNAPACLNPGTFSTVIDTISVQAASFIPAGVVGTQGMNPPGFGSTLLVSKDGCTFPPPLDVTEKKIINYLLVYPNPAHNRVRVESSTKLGTIRIYNPLGILVREIATENREEELDIRNLPTGIYFIVITSSQQNVSRKIMID
jgi:hypothetical protein